MQTDGEACRVKSQMLETFDYAWNKVDNGKRRSNDILQMLNIISSNKLPMTADKSDEVEKNSSFVDESITKNDVGTSDVALEVKVNHQLADEKSYEAENNSSFVDESITKNDVGTSEVASEVEVNHQLADDKSDEAENNSSFVDESITKNDVGTLEVALEAEVDHQLAEASPLKKKGRSDKGEANKKKDGTVCTKPPVEKRFSCHEHKGMRINLFSAKAIRRSKSESEILAGSFVDESITKNDVGTSEVVLEAKVDHQLAEAFPLKKKGKNDKGEANKKMVECFLEVKTDRSLWNKNFDRAGFVKDHFNLYEDFEATRKSNHSNTFHDASVSCLRSVVLLEVMEEEFQAVKSNADRLKQENEDLKLRVKTLEDQLKESSNSSKTTKDVKKKDEEDKRDIEANKCVELNNNYGVIKGEVEKDVKKITELKDGVENAKKRWLGIWKRGRLRSHVVIPKS